MASLFKIGFLVVSITLFTGPPLIAHDPCSAQLQRNDLSRQPVASRAEFDQLPEIAESQVLLPQNPLPGTQFGFRLAVRSDLLAVASRNWFGDQKASLDLFAFDDGIWQHLKTLTSPANQAYESFRLPLFDGDKLLVGAPGYCSTGEGGGCDEGTVWVFDRNKGGADNWGLVQQLDGDFKPWSAFGAGMALDKNTLAVYALGEPLSGTENDGAVYLFQRDPDSGAEWRLVKRIESDEIWDINWAYSLGGIYIRADTLLVHGHDTSGMVLKEFQRNKGGADNWGFVGQIRRPQTRLNSGDFDGETLMLHLQDDCVPAEARRHWLDIYAKNDQGNWIVLQKMDIPRESENVVMDGPIAVLGSDAEELGFLLKRAEGSNDWAFSARLVLEEAPGPYTEPHPKVALDAGRAVVGASYASYMADREGFAVAYQVADPINAGHAGAWFNPETSGQGQLIDVEPESQFMFLSWFTYTDSASPDPDEQHWYTAQGNYVGNEASLVVYETLGGKFDDPRAVSTQAVGEVTVSFADCGLGQMDYTIDPPGLSGSIPLRRLIQGSGNLCEQQAITPQSVDINAGMDGAWFDESTSGQGFLIDAHPNPDGSNFVFVAWFTYGEDTASGQRWLTAQGDFEGSGAALDVYETTGGRFDDATPVDTVKVGTMSLDFQDCSHALLTYSLANESLGNSVAISRAIPGSQALCEELAGNQ